MTREEAQSRRDRCVQAVRDAQLACSKAVGLERDRAKTTLAIRLQELADAKAELRKANLASQGIQPIEPSPPKRMLSTSETAVVLLESFQRLLIADPGHAAIRTLRAHFEAERLRETSPAAQRVEPAPFKSAGRNFLDSTRRQASGPGTVLYPNVGRVR